MGTCNKYEVELGHTWIKIWSAQQGPDDPCMATVVELKSIYQSTSVLSHFTPPPIREADNSLQC